MRYFGNTTGRCFASALCNLLGEVFKDEPMADKIYYDSFEGHPLVLPSGATFHLVWPKLVRDLTENHYTARLYKKIRHRREREN